jgi:hypothetical protein
MPPCVAIKQIEWKKTAVAITHALAHTPSATWHNQSFWSWVICFSVYDATGPRPIIASMRGAYAPHKADDR